MWPSCLLRIITALLNIMKQVWSWWKDNFRQCPGSWLIEGIFTLWTLKDNPSWHVSASLPLVPGDVIHILEYACLFVRDQKTPHHKFMHQWSQIVYTLWIYINHKYYLLNTLHRSIDPRGSAGTRLLAGPSGLLDFIFPSGAQAVWHVFMTNNQIRFFGDGEQ